MLHPYLESLNMPEPVIHNNFAINNTFFFYKNNNKYPNGKAVLAGVNIVITPYTWNRIVGS